MAGIVYTQGEAEDVLERFGAGDDYSSAEVDAAVAVAPWHALRRAGRRLSPAQFAAAAEAEPWMAQRVAEELRLVRRAAARI